MCYNLMLLFFLFLHGRSSCRWNVLSKLQSIEKIGSTIFLVCSLYLIKKHAAILCLWGLKFPVPGLLSVSCKMYCSCMWKVQLYYELSPYNRSKMAAVEQRTPELLGSMVKKWTLINHRVVKIGRDILLTKLNNRLSN